MSNYKCVLVCGGRDYDDIAKVSDTLDGLQPDMVIHGAARGADQLAQVWVDKHGVDFMQYPAKWETHGKAAGPIRNAKMLLHGKPDLVVAFPGGKGTADMIAQATRAGIPVMRIL